MEISEMRFENRVKHLLYLIGMLLLPTIAYAGQVTISSGDLPYTTVAKYDTIKFTASKITTSGSGIWVDHDSVCIDLQEDTLEFGTGYGDNLYGIANNYGIQGLHILGNASIDNGGLILHGGGTDIGVDSSWDNSCVIVDDVYEDFEITNVDMEIYGWDGHNVEIIGSAGRELTISGGYWINHVEGFTSRGSMDAASFVGRIDDATVIIHDLVIDCWHSAIRWGVDAGTGHMEIYNCSLVVDAKNDLYSYPSATMQSSLQSSGISCYVCGAGTKIYDNKIYAGIDNEGCELGILLDYATGTSIDTIKVYGNYINIHRGPGDVYVNGPTVKAYKHRWEAKYIHVHDNEFHVSAHADSGDHASAWSINAKGIEISATSSDYGEAGAFCDSFVIIENNRCFVEALSAGCNAQGAEITIRCDEDTPLYYWAEAGNIWRNNYLKSTYYGYYFGKSDAGSCVGLVVQGDTLESYGDADYDAYRLGIWDKPCTANVVIDMTYLGGATEGDYEWRETFGANLAAERTVNVLVVGTGGTPLESVEVGVVSNYSGADTLYDVTDENGLADPILRYAKYIYGSDDSTSYNDFVIQALYDGEYLYDTLTVAWNNFDTVEINFETNTMKTKMKGMK